MVAGNTIVSFLFSFGVSLDAGLVAGSTSLSLSHSLSLSLPSLSLRLPPLCSSLLPASPPTPCHTQAFNLSFPFLTPGSTPYRITACRGAWAFHCAAGNRTNHPSSSLQETVTSFPFLVLPLPAPPHTFRFPSLRRGLYTLLDNRVQGCLGLLLCSWQPHQPSSQKSHLLHFELSGAWFRRTPGFDPSGA